MCSRGVYQLSKLSLYFCDFGGSSSGVRSLLISDKWKNFMQQNPQIAFDFICKRNHHPYVHGAYINGYLKNIPLRNLPQEEIFNHIFGLRNQMGRKSFEAHGTRVYGAKKSIQGLWKPNMFNKYPIAELQKTHRIPWVKVGTKEKTIKNYEILKDRDTLNTTLKLKDMSNGSFISNKGSQI